MATMERRCSECNRTKARHLWLASEWKKKGPGICKSCYKKGPAYDRNLDARYQREFGITLDEYNELLEAQLGRCAICRKKPGRRRLAIDHDHALEHQGIRESVRGLLCRACNEFLGHIGDDMNAGNRIQTYLWSPPAARILGMQNPPNQEFS